MQEFQSWVDSCLRAAPIKLRNPLGFISSKYYIWRSERDQPPPKGQ